MSRIDFLVSWVGIDYDDSLPARRSRRLDVRWHNWRWQPLGLERVSVGIRFSIKAYLSPTTGTSRPSRAMFSAR
ncbi:hypothetical protein CMK14_13735 [Candidatus Poribacteria bacterium]|nr:hypothetical protein [Candidatus Poribacteria bacterium]